MRFQHGFAEHDSGAEHDLAALGVASALGHPGDDLAAIRLRAVNPAGACDDRVGMLCRKRDPGRRTAGLADNRAALGTRRRIQWAARPVITAFELDRTHLAVIGKCAGLRVGDNRTRLP